MSGTAITVRGLFKKYEKIIAVDNLNLDVQCGEIFGLLGPNGAGKTTTLEIIEGITPQDGGQVNVLDMDVRTHASAIKARIGVQFQTTALDEKITPREALDLFACYYPNSCDINKLLKMTQLEEKADAFNQALSGGQRQRLALALALVNNPEVVFLDEPTTGLDPQARRGLWDIVRQIRAEGRTVLITTHYMEEAEALCDRIAIMDHGKLLQVGTPRELIDSLEIPSLVELSFDGAVPEVDGFAAKVGRTVEAKAGHWAIPVIDPKVDLRPILECAELTGVPFKQVHVRGASLEDVFLHHTGRSLRD
jgi:ABC-2 type transport system ATP-binding protein